jgi:hypothetical protein
VVSSNVFSLLFLYILGLRVIKRMADDRVGELLLVVQVGLAVVTATTLMEAFALTPLNRELAGEYFYAASTLTVALIAAYAASRGRRRVPGGARLQLLYTLFSSCW